MKFDYKSKNFRIFASLIIALLLVVMGMRACSSRVHLGKKSFVIAHDASWYPLDFRGKEQIMTVFSEELIGIIGAQADYSIHFTDVSTSNLYYGLDNEYYDAVISSILPNAINKREYYFSDSFYPIGPVLVVRVSSTIAGVNDLKGKIIGVESGIQQLYHVDEGPNYVTISYKNIPTALENLQRDIIDAVLMDSLSAYAYTQGYYAGKLKVATPPLIDGGLRVVALISPRNEQFISAFNEGLKDVKENGLYDRELTKWELPKP